MPRMRTSRLTAALFLGLLAARSPTAAGEEERPLWVAVARPALADALQPLIEHRSARGFETKVVRAAKEAPGGLAAVLKALPRPPAYVLLVGDDAEGAAEAAWRLPAPRRTLYRWRLVQRTEFAADALLGDLDGDLLPDVPVGRIPARTPAEVARVVRKILAYERRAPTADDLRIVAWAGTPGYGKLLDGLATGFLITTVRTRAPAWAGRFLLSAAPDQELSGVLSDQPRIFNRELGRGALLGAIVSHASLTRVTLTHAAGTSVLYGPEETERAFAQGPPLAPLAILACDCGAFDREVPSLAETLLFLPGGPVAVVAATTESHPLTNYYTGRALLEALGSGAERIGDVWVRTAREARDARSLLIERALEDAEGSLDGDIDVERLRRDQALLYALLGDPATRLPIPEPLEAAIERTDAGWRWKVVRPPGAHALHVSVRAEGAKADRDAEPAARLEQANAATAFHPRPGPAADAPWEGVVEAAEGDWLRLVATGPGVFRVFVAQLGP